MKIKKILTLIVLLVGILFIIYPFVAKIVSLSNQTIAITNYKEKINEMSNEDIDNSQEKATDFNNNLYENNSYNASLTNETISSIDFAENEILGYITIPKIDLELPIYEGSSDEVLSLGIGHLLNTSLPIGGINSHSVLVRTYWFNQFNNV